MKESIIIKNFGPLKEVEIDDIKPLTVFIGKSAGGKSIIMKVIVLMRYIYKMVNIRSYLKNAKITRSPFKLRFNSLLHDGLKGMITAQTEIYYTVEINGNKYTLKYTNRGLQSDINIPDKDLIFFKEAYVSGMRSLIPIWASKAVSVKGENLGFFFHETFNDFNDATDVIKEQKLEYLNLKMKVRKSGNRPKLFTIESLQNDAVPIIRKTKCFDFWERNVLFPQTKRSFFRTPKHPLPCPFPLNFSLLIITKKFGNLAKNRYICIV